MGHTRGNGRSTGLLDDGQLSGFLGSGTTVGGMHEHVLQCVAGRPVDWRSDDERALAMHALADFHARFEGRTVAEVFPALGAPPLAAEALPDPLDDAPPAATGEPLVLDPGDVRPENFMLTSNPPAGNAGRVLLIDFENAGVRRRSVALAAMLRNCPAGGDSLAGYARRARQVSQLPRTARPPRDSEPSRKSTRPQTSSQAWPLREPL